MKVKNIATGFAILAAALYAINIPLSKLLLNHVDATMMAAFLYLGAGIGISMYRFVNKVIGKRQKGRAFNKKRITIHNWNGGT